MESCLFCKIVAKEIQADIVYEDDDVLAFNDIHPKYPIHVLLIPKRHIASAGELENADDPLVGKLLRVGAELATGQGIAEKGFRLLTNTGPDSGQEVRHLHVHLLGGERLRPL